MKRLTILIIFILISTLTIKAQDTLSLSFQEAVQIGLENNITLKQQKNILEVNFAERNQRRALYFPSVGASTDFSRQDGRNFDERTGQLYTESIDGGSLGIGANYVIFDGLYRLNMNKSAKYSLLAQDNMVKRTQQEIIWTVADQYLQSLLDKELFRIAEKNLELQQTTLEQIRGFVEAGTRPLSHQLDQEAQVRQLETQVIRAENQLRLDKAILMQTLMLDPNLVLEPIDPNWGIEEIVMHNPELDDLYETALENRPDLKQQVATQIAAKADVKVAGSYYYPKLEAFANYGSGYSSQALDAQGEKIPINEQITDWNRGSQIGLRMNIPIYDQNRIRYNKVRAKMTNENAKLTLQDLELQIFRDVQISYLNFVAAKNEYSAAQSQFEAGQAAYNIQKERYDVGVGNLVELALSTNTLVKAAADRAQAEYSLLFQKVILDYYTGTLSASNL
ncbi:TolC family protein [Bacteroidota bacterium]